MDPETKIAPVDESPSMFLYSHSEVDQDLSYLSAFEDEVTRLQHCLPECSMDCFDGTVDFETFNSLKGFNIGSFSCAFKYDQIKFDGDALDLYLAQEGEEKKNSMRNLEPCFFRMSDFRESNKVDHFDNCNDEEVSVSNEDFDKETSSADSQDNISKSECVKRRGGAGKKRQCHQRWTTCEVMKLIEGVSKFGVGKWTHIKKSLFSSSSHRTSVNLKDKWRNLLKASSNGTQKRRKVEQEQTHASHQLPESVWRQVRELAVIYSYPRKSKSKVSSTSLAPSTPNYYC